MSENFIQATRELCDDLDYVIELAKLSRAPIRAVSLIERPQRPARRFQRHSAGPLRRIFP
jgi:hypothetical protein